MRYSQGLPALCLLLLSYDGSLPSVLCVQSSVSCTLVQKIPWALQCFWM
jgi:hypothetical protein